MQQMDLQTQEQTSPGLKTAFRTKPCLEDSVSDETLRDALAGMINDNRVDAIDDEMVDWAREIPYGKTEEIRNATEDPAAADTPANDPDQPAALPA